MWLLSSISVVQGLHLTALKPASTDLEKGLARSSSQRPKIPSGFLQSPCHQRGFFLSSSRLQSRASRASGIRGAMADATSVPVDASSSSVPLEIGTDLLIVGPGVLGKLVAKSWRQAFPDAHVVGQTRTNTRHEELKALGITPAMRDDATAGEGNDKSSFPFVIFCAPPYGNDDYVGEVRAAAERWNGKGTLLFTSSSAVYDVSNNDPCPEGAAPVIPKGRSPRTDRLLDAEDAVLSVGGCVVRLAGLYLQDRGAHTFWMSKGSVDSRPDHIVNLIHYEDAASLCAAILRLRHRGKAFMGCDNHPVSREEVMRITVNSGKFQGNFTGFTVTDGPLGKRMNNDETRKALRGWKPKYPSFAAFLLS
eukprot:TRINITY_DN11011_c0_g1_i1.p1 TRINITY_DN11011_c0_g1~~TRINITY_DN11011_c0_g1_i1.p1  ORF type:complete len:364 (-),score=45.21 TRINITY_DN11011_c0_g1_i1:659-1750(-)